MCHTATTSPLQAIDSENIVAAGVHEQPLRLTLVALSKVTASRADLTSSYTTKQKPHGERVLRLMPIITLETGPAMAKWEWMREAGVEKARLPTYTVEDCVETFS